MAQHYSRGPPAKSRGAIDDNWQAPSHQSHRAGGGGGVGGGYAGGNPAIPPNVAPNVPPNIAMTAGGQPQPPPISAMRLNEILEAVRQEFEGIVHDNSMMKNQKDEFETQGQYIRIHYA